MNYSKNQYRQPATSKAANNTQFWLRESLFVVFLMLAVLSALALVSWQDGQNSVFQFNHTMDENLQKHNLIGVFGEQFSGLLFNVFGHAALAVPLILLGFGAQLLRAKSLSYQPVKIMLKVISALIFLPSLSCLLGWHFSSESSVTAGGFISMALADYWVSDLPLVLSTSLVLILMLLSAASAFGFSWLKLSSWLGEQLMDLVSHESKPVANSAVKPSQNKSDAKAAKKLLKHQQKEAAAAEKAEKKALKSSRKAAKQALDKEQSERQYSLELTDTQLEDQADAYFNEPSEETEQHDFEPMFIEDDFSIETETIATEEAIVEKEVIVLPDIEDESSNDFDDYLSQDEAIKAEENIVEPVKEKKIEQKIADKAEALTKKIADKKSEVIPEFKAEIDAEGDIEQAATEVQEPTEVIEEVIEEIKVAEPVVKVEAEQEKEIIPDIDSRDEAETPKSIKIEPLKSEASIRPQELEIPDNAPATPVSDHKDLPLPTLDILGDPPVNDAAGFTDEQLVHMSELLIAKLAEFGVKAEVEAVCPGPVITRFEIQPAPGVKVSKITNLAKDIARSMAMVSIRVVEVIPGKSVVGIEIPNQNRAIVSFKKLLGSKAFEEDKSPVALGLGDDIAGEAVIADLAKMPHLLVAGTTGSGKSVGVNAMIISMLYKATPEQLRLILIDPKMLELSIYEGIPHLLTPVITDMNDAANGLRWSVAEMERRYKLMAKMGVRNLAGFNAKIQAAIDAGEPIQDPLWEPDQHLDNTTIPTLEPLPFVVIVIDEFADMMMIVGKKVEELIARIAQKARAAGIHLILATQRPSVDVITGLIKANVPTRISFQVSSKIDSRTILDQGGAEQLLGHGDMLYMPPGSSIPVRVHGAFVTDEDVHSVVECWKAKGEPNYINAVTEADYDDSGMLAGLVETDPNDETDALFDEAIAFVTSAGKVSISSVQRKLRIGYNRAARLVESMEAAGVVSPPEHNGTRKVLANPPPADY